MRPCSPVRTQALALIFALPLLSGLTPVALLGEEPEEQFLAVIDQAALSAEDPTAFEQMREYYLKHAAGSLRTSVFPIVDQGPGLFAPESYFELASAALSMIEARGFDDPNTFGVYETTVTHACNLALSTDAIDRSHAFCDRFTDAIDLLAREQWDHRSLLPNSRVTLASLRVRSLLAEGLVDLAAAELSEMRRNTADARQKGLLDEHSQELLLDLETQVLNELERFEALLRKIAEAKETFDWVEDHPRMTLRHATALWWLADRNLEAATIEREGMLREARSAFERAIELAPDRELERVARRLFCHFLFTVGDIETAAAEIATYAPLVAEELDPFDDRMLAFLRARLAREQGEAEALARSAEETRTTVEKTIEQWRTIPLRSGGRGLLHYSEMRLLFAEHLLHAARTGGDTAALEAWLQLESAGSLVRSLRATQPTVAALQERIENRGALVYLACRDFTLLLTIDRVSVRLHRLPGRLAIDVPRRELLRALGDSPTTSADRAARREAIDRSGRALAAQLIPEEVEDWIHTRSALTIVDLDSLGFVPFACLPLSNGEFLGLEKPLGLPSSLTVEHAIATRPVPQDAFPFELRVIGDPSFGADAGLPSLPLHPARRRRLIAPFSSGKTELVVGKQATLESITEGSRAGVLLCLTHGGRVTSRERYAALRLAPSPRCPDGRASVDQFEGMRAALYSVVFACDGGRGPSRAGDAGITDLAGAFLRGGSRSAITARENIEYLPTLRIAEEFGHSITAGRSPAKAMRDAYRVLASDPKWADPRHIAFFTIRGDAHTAAFPTLSEYLPPTERPSESRITIVGSAILAGGLLLVALRLGRSRRPPREPS